MKSSGKKGSLLRKRELALKKNLKKRKKNKLSIGKEKNVSTFR